MAAKAPTTPEL